MRACVCAHKTEKERGKGKERETSFAKAVVSPMWWWSHCNAPKLTGREGV